jgi:hypothetical protein
MNIQSIIASAAFLVSCSEDSGSSLQPDPTEKPLTCAVIDGPNCWKDAIAAVAACAPGNATPGVLASDRLTCTYASGAVVRSSRPLTTLNSDLPVLDFDLDVGGNVCAHYDQQNFASGHDTRSLLTSLGTVTWTLDDQVTLACPDGSRFAAPLREAIECEGFFDVGWLSVTSQSSASFSFFTAAEPIDVFECESGA